MARSVVCYNFLRFRANSSRRAWGYVIGYELLPLNGMLTFLGLILIRRQ